MYFPHPHPDELIGSLLARACRQLGLPAKRLARRLGGRRLAPYSFVLPGNLADIARFVPIEPDELLWKHTMFPYVTAFLPPQVRVAIRDKLLGAAALPVWSAGSLIRSISGSITRRRFCPLCTVEDARTYGEPYRHRLHHLPGVDACPMHGVALHENEVPLSNMRPGLAADLPHQSRSTAVGLLASPAVEVAVRRRSVAALAASLEPREDWLAAYRAAALAGGFCLPSGDVASRRVNVELMGAFTADYLTRMRCAYSPKSYDAWPGRMLRTATLEPFAPAKHIVLSAFFDLGGATTERHVYEQPGPKTRDRTHDDARCVRRVRWELAKLEQQQRRATVSELLDAAGYWQQFRHHRDSFPQTRKLLEQFRRSRLAARQIGGRRAVSTPAPPDTSRPR